MSPERNYVTLPVETVLVALVAVFFTILTYVLVSQNVDPYFPADAAHYVGDADALWGRGVRELRHPLFFPMLVALGQPFLGDIGAFHLSMGVGLFLLPISLHLSLRQWFTPIPSLAGAALGSLTPAVGELVGWSGGATLLALDFMFLAIASFEAWSRKGGRRGLLVGLFLGLTALSHPFVFGAACFVVAVRWVFHLSQTRSFSLDWGPSGLRGIGSVLGVAAGLLSISMDYYLRLKAPGQGGSINLDLPGEFLFWGIRENTFVLFFLLLALLLPLPLSRPSLLVVTGSIASLFLAVPLVVSWDISYSSRVVYLLPPVFGAGAALFISLALLELRENRKLRNFEVPILVAILLTSTIGAGVGLGFADRVQFAAQYYQWIHADDLPAFDYLRSGQGTVATSWTRGFQDQGSVSAWFVEALSKRPALGPGAPWLSTLTTVGAAELDMQRLFSGSVGLENGALQASASRAGGLRDPAVQVSVGGFYYPLFFVNTYANDYPIAVVPGSVVSADASSIVQRHDALGGTGEVFIETRLETSRAIVSFSLRNASAPAGNWTVWVWPAYFRPWTDVTPDQATFIATQAVRDTTVTTRFRTGGVGVSMTNWGSDPRWGIQGIEIRAVNQSSIDLEASVTGGDSPGIQSAYGEDPLIARYGLTSVLLWKDTGWRFRFEVSSRFEPVFESPNVIVYAVR